MGAIDNFLKRFGYARLDRYGLVLTPDDRVISTRPAVLDDGAGSRIVGWAEGDLAAMELDRWGAIRPAAAKSIAAPASLHELSPAPAPARRAAQTIAPAAAIAPLEPAAPMAPRPLPDLAATCASAAAASTAPTQPAAITAPAAPQVAADEEPGEDEWEWEIAMARARAAADEAEQARADLVGASAVIAAAAMQPRNTTPGLAVPKPEPLPDFPQTEPYNESWHDKSEVSPQVLSPLQKKVMVARSTPARGTTSIAPRPANAQQKTVIPVPALPSTVVDPSALRPVVSSSSSQLRRGARGTGAPSSRSEETVRTTAAPANDDRTSPYIELPSEVKPSGFARTKRVAAKQR